MSAGSVRSPAAKLSLPPYGYMNSLYTWDIDTRRSPEAFAVEGRSGTAVDWRSFLERFADESADIVWPRWEPQGKSDPWKGRAAARCLDLTAADLELLNGAMLRKLLEPAGDKPPRSKVTHKALFQEEDEGKPGVLYPTLDLYLPDTPAEMLTSLKEAIKKALVDFGPAPLRLKELLQRPRPYQVAFLMRPGAAADSFRFELARSSMTPSIPSGHALQGLVGRCAGYLAQRLKLEDIVGAIDGLMQYSVDIGDRRVYAGVHYPSDNIVSWVFALRLCDYLFRGTGRFAKEFMCKAIEKSAVYSGMMKVAESDRHSPYAVPMKWLQDEMQRPVKGYD